MEKDRMYSKKPFHKGKSPGTRKGFRKPDGGRRERRPLTVGATYRDREMGLGVVKALTEEKIVVLFGEVEKVFPRRRPMKPEEKPVGREGTGKKPGGTVFTFAGAREKLLEKKPRATKREVKIGIHVEDCVLGPGVVSKITERGTYVTYERTGEHVLYPQGLTKELLKSAFPSEKKKERVIGPKEKARVYKVPMEERPKKEEVPSTTSNHGGYVPIVHHISVGEGTKVSSPFYGQGIIIEVTNDTFVVDFSGTRKVFPYPASLSRGDLVVIEE